MIHAWLQEDPSSNSSDSSSLLAAAVDVPIAASGPQHSFAAAAAAGDVGGAVEGFAVLLDGARSVSPSKAMNEVRDSRLGRDVLTPCTPVRTSRDV